MRTTAALMVLGWVTSVSLLAQQFDCDLKNSDRSATGVKATTKLPRHEKTHFGFRTNLDDTLRRANETQKPVFIYFHDSTCEAFCKSLEEGIENGRFDKMQDSHVLAMLDSAGETADFCKTWNLKRSNSYVLLMHVGRLTTTTSDGKRIKGLSEKSRVVNPKKLDTIFAMLDLLEEDKKRR